jgi:hypothetical protein
MTATTLRYANLAGAGTTTVKSGAGRLVSLVVGTPAASGSIVVYDNTAGSGTKISSIVYPGTLLTSGPISCVYDAPFSTGLTVVVVGSIDATVSYY